MMDGDRVVYATAEGAVTRFWAIPTANTSAILLGNGTSITQAAARRFAEERILLAFTGSGGTPIFYASTSEYAVTEHLQKWIAFWPNVEARLACAKYLMDVRCRTIAELWPKGPLAGAPPDIVDAMSRKTPSARNIEQLRGFEGELSKELYKTAARHAKIPWSGRSAGQDGSDLANRFLDHGNYIAYGLAGIVLWAMGVPPGLAVNHGATRAGGLVFDLADCVKDAIVLPHAFQAASKGLRAQNFRDALIDDVDRLEILPALFRTFTAAIDVGIEAAR
jgi:CRISPR-associated protein Cas1